MRFSLFLLISSVLGWGVEIRSVKVTGDSRAEVHFIGELPEQAPQWKINDNTLELTFSGTRLASELSGKLDLESPHALIRRLSLYSLDENTVRGKVVINGSLDSLKNRIRLGKDGKNLLLAVDFPKNESATLKLLQEEQAPLAAGGSPQKPAVEKGMGGVAFLVAVLAALAGLITFIFVKLQKAKGKLGGTRKYLIEQLGYCSLGPKAGVSLIRVGREFVLVGVTSNQVSLLSSLPKLQEQYEEETGFEHNVFKEAIAEQVRRIK